MFKFAVYLIIVRWCVGLTGGSLLADIFDLVGAFLSLLERQGGRSDVSSSGRASLSREERDMRDCNKTTSGDGHDSISAIADKKPKPGQDFREFNCEFMDNVQTFCKDLPAQSVKDFFLKNVQHQNPGYEIM
ncbi:hypothetical protein HDE_10784 [Halotydeus destructor]|nr:hypothetical protein HDE_10784 [Halotydeus destructor]